MTVSSLLDLIITPSSSTLVDSDLCTSALMTISDHRPNTNKPQHKALTNLPREPTTTAILKASIWSYLNNPSYHRSTLNLARTPLSMASPIRWKPNHNINILDEVAPLKTGHTYTGPRYRRKIGFHPRPLTLRNIDVG